jgi:molybdopterin-guanine dinucleotide biosynthesis protein A
MTARISAAVLAGGEGRRMGRDKRSLPIAGRTLVAHVTATLAAISDDVMIACRDRDQVDAATARRLGARRVVDEVPDAGPLAGIAAALHRARYPYVLVAAVDMPFLAPALLQLVADRAIDHRQAVIVRSPRGLEPLLAAYPRSDAQRADALLRTGHRALRTFVAAIDHDVVEPADWLPIDPDGTSFVNWNTPEDVRQ